jgi:hypothetical protein
VAIIDSRARRMHVDDPRVKKLVVGAVAWTVLAIPAVLFLPLYTSTSESSDGGTTTTSTDGISIVDQDGWGILPTLLVPLVLSLVALAWGQRSRTALVVPALLYDLGVILAILSIGIFFAPAAIALTIAALARRD